MFDGKRKARLKEYQKEARRLLTWAQDYVRRETLHELTPKDVDLWSSNIHSLFCQADFAGGSFESVGISRPEIELVLSTHLINVARHAWRQCQQEIKEGLGDTPISRDEACYLKAYIENAGGWRVLDLALSGNEFPEVWSTIPGAFVVPPPHRCVPNLAAGIRSDVSYLINADGPG